MRACELCKGACCETVVLPSLDDTDGQRWLGYHGVDEGRFVRFECACRMLKEGLCSIYNERPRVCSDMEVGSLVCQMAVRSRRKNAAEILDLIFPKEANA